MTLDLTNTPLRKYYDEAWALVKFLARIGVIFVFLFAFYSFLWDNLGEKRVIIAFYIFLSMALTSGFDRVVKAIEGKRLEGKN